MPQAGLAAGGLAATGHVDVPAADVDAGPAGHGDLVVSGVEAAGEALWPCPQSVFACLLFKWRDMTTTDRRPKPGFVKLISATRHQLVLGSCPAARDLTHPK